MEPSWADSEVEVIVNRSPDKVSRTKFSIGKPDVPAVNWVHTPNQARLFWPLWLLESSGRTGAGPLTDPQPLPAKDSLKLPPEQLLEQWQRKQVSMIANGDTPLHFLYYDKHLCERAKQGDLLALLQLFMVAYGSKVITLSTKRRHRFIEILQEFGLDQMQSWLNLDEYAPPGPNYIAAARVLRDFALAAQVVSMRTTKIHMLTDEWWTYKARIHPAVERLLLLQSLNGKPCYQPEFQPFFEENSGLLSIVRWVEGNSPFDPGLLDQVVAEGGIWPRSKRFSKRLKSEGLTHWFRFVFKGLKWVFTPSGCPDSKELERKLLNVVEPRVMAWRQPEPTPVRRAETKIGPLIDEDDERE